jgi:hypothetical protein
MRRLNSRRLAVGDVLKWASLLIISPVPRHDILPEFPAAMKGLLYIVLSILLTMICWGIYGPVLKLGQDAMHGGGLRPFICVGLAYFAIAVVVPIMMLKMVGEKGHWSATGLFWSIFAGVVTAVGALGIIFAFTFHGSPVYVMPLVFGGAPVVNSFVTIHFSRAYKQIGPIFIAGLIVVVIGALTVMLSAPHPAPAQIAATAAGAAATTAAPTVAAPTHEWRDKALVILFTLMTALCWGIYGPTLHKGQMAMAGSRLRPFLCVGLAYFLIAVLVPYLLLAISPGLDPGEWNVSGTIWSLLGGAAGAIGALGIILAFNFGGKPIYVMPLVFGGAPVINTLVALTKSGTVGQVGPLFIAGLILVAAGAVTVLIFAPRPPAHGPSHALEPEVAEKEKEPAKLAPRE